MVKLLLDNPFALGAVAAGIVFLVAVVFFILRNH